MSYLKATTEDAFPHRVPLTSGNLQAATDWCNQNLGRLRRHRLRKSGRWTPESHFGPGVRTFGFKNISDAILFKMAESSFTPVPDLDAIRAASLAAWRARHVAKAYANSLYGQLGP